MSPEITDHGGPRAPESPETDLQSNVDPVKQVTDTNNRSPTIGRKELGADLTSTEATLDLREICESNGFEGNSNPDNEPTLSQEIPKQAPTGDEDEDSPLNDVPPEGNAGDSEDDDFPVFEGGFPRGRIVSTVVGRPPPKPKPRPK
ncbi:hypothetical protein M413DRAFT_440428 [Hebeloma cylindrosporum]|uniref:Uncharacterized protein n=1 Tax=Hebeloma cylindrosporum TaxID=76867 RepID=A0A0C2YAI5_HEBCY|nr:hypothetical protein M413DRAFT_440428 [Hebeloma cylindrosporum h7]